MKDESIARQLGLSHRTVARRVRALMEREHARSRYQAGYRLGLQAADRTPDSQTAGAAEQGGRRPPQPEVS